MKTLIVTILLTFFILTSQAASIRTTVNPKQIADIETKAWQAYYAKDPTNLYRDIVTSFKLQFGVTTTQALKIAHDYGQAALRFARLPRSTPYSTYQKTVLPFLLQAYQALNHYVKLHNYKDAAKYDLKWWIQRRNPQTANPKTIGHTMAKMYEAIFGTQGIKYFERAAYLRSVAAQYRDLSNANWGNTTSEDWRVVNRLLVEVYQYLNMGIQLSK